MKFAGSRRPRLEPQSDLGAVDSALQLSQISLIFRPSDSQQADLERLLAGQQDPQSASYHLWLSPEEYGDRFGLSRDDLARVTAWLQAEGFVIDYVPHSRSRVVFSGTAAQIESSFATEIHRYRVNGDMHFANATEVSLPAELAPLVQGVQGLDDFQPQPASWQNFLRPDYTDPTGGHELSPDDYATIYDLNPVYNAGYQGTGQTIVVVGRCHVNVNDVRLFRALSGLPAKTPQLVLVPGSADPGASSFGDCIEADLDLEWAGAVARDATIVYVYGTKIDAAIQYAIDENLAPVISESFGGCEHDFLPALASYETLARQANAQGITWLAASGDTGAAVCDQGSGFVLATQGLSTSVPAVVPEVTAVGGTEFSSGNYWSTTNSSTGASALGYIPEMAWNDIAVVHELAATGGGLSRYFPEPAWQITLGVASSGKRAVPDISLTASPVIAPYRIVFAGQLFAVGGTSAATPSFAGMIALLNQHQGGRQGNINPNLYSLYRTTPNAFHDITTGTNAVPCVPGSPDCLIGIMGYRAGRGYDMVTGLGSVDAWNLINCWNGCVINKPAGE